MRRIAGAAEFGAAFSVSRETLARLATYEGVLRGWQRAVNLVAPSTLDAIWHRHFADSAQLAPLAPAASTKISTTTRMMMSSGMPMPAMAKKAEGAVMPVS